MQHFKRTLIAMDLSKTDRSLLKMAAMLALPLEISQFYLLHVMPDFARPSNLDVEFYKLFNPEYPVDEKVRDKLKLEAAEILGDNPARSVEVNVVEGNPYEKLLHWIDVKMINLLMVGHKKISQGSGIQARKVARASKTNILYVTENPPERIRRILVPTDFSDEGVNALRTALNLSYAIGNVEVTLLHVIPQPSAVFYDPAWEYNTFQDALKESAKRSCDKFIAENGFEGDHFETVMIDDDFSSISRHIHEYAVEHRTDLIVMGAKGHTALNNLIFGSVTESLLERSREHLMLVVR